MDCVEQLNDWTFVTGYSRGRESINLVVLQFISSS